MRRALAIGEFAAYAFVAVELAHLAAILTQVDSRSVYWALLIAENVLVAGMAVGWFGARAWLAGAAVLVMAASAMAAMKPVFAWEILVLSFDFTDFTWVDHTATVATLVGSAALAGAVFRRRERVGNELAWVVFATLFVGPLLYLALFFYTHVSLWQTVAKRDHAAEAFGVARLIGIVCAGVASGRLRRRA